MSTVKQLFNRILLIGGTSNIQVTTESPLRMQEQLEDSVTYVAEFEVIEQLAAPLSSNTPVQIDQVNRLVNDGSGYLTRRLFTGTINHIEGTSYPNSAAVTCTGKLGRLRLTRTTDMNLTGMTDGAAVKAILSYCAIPYVAADIFDYGYVLGAVKPVKWQKGTSAAEMVQELDRVFAMATIEIGSGRVVRIPYSRVPNDYASAAIAAQFRRGDGTTEFYDNSRSRGDIEAIQNYWRVSGLSYTGPEHSPTEGCNYTFFATGQDVHPKLGAGVFIGPNEFSSDIIQSEVLAKQIARRMMRWYNREPDTIRITTFNNPLINVGDVVTVLDPAWGIDLTGTKRYLVLSISREGDDMTIDGVGGTAGEQGTIHGGIEVCCGTQQEDGTCVDDGTNPDDGGGPSPSAPPDSMTGHCDPLTDTTCDPVIDYDVPEDFDTEHPFINCEDSGELVNAITTPWRELDDVHWRFDETSEFASGIYTLTQGVIAYNVTPFPTVKTFDNDFRFGGGGVVCVSGKVKFCADVGDNPQVFIELFPAPDSLSGLWGKARFAAKAITSDYPTHASYSAQMYTEHQAATYDDAAPMHGCAPGLTASGTTGGLSGASVGFDPAAENAFNVCFAVNESPQRITYSGDWGSGYHADLTCMLGGVEGPPTTACTHANHVLWITFGAGGVLEPGTHECPKAEITQLSLGFATVENPCDVNPDFTDPFATLVE